MATPTISEIAELLSIDISDNRGKLELSKAGVFTYRVGYFWRPKHTPEQWATTFEKRLKEIFAGTFNVKVIEAGDKWAPFRGSEGIKKNSHYWVKFTVKEK